MENYQIILNHLVSLIKETWSKQNILVESLPSLKDPTKIKLYVTNPHSRRREQIVFIEAQEFDSFCKLQITFIEKEKTDKNFRENIREEFKVYISLELLQKDCEDALKYFYFKKPQPSVT